MPRVQSSGPGFDLQSCIKVATGNSCAGEAGA